MTERIPLILDDNAPNCPLSETDTLIAATMKAEDALVRRQLPPDQLRTEFMRLLVRDGFLSPEDLPEQSMSTDIPA